MICRVFFLFVYVIRISFLTLDEPGSSTAFGKVIRIPSTSPSWFDGGIISHGNGWIHPEMESSVWNSSSSRGEMRLYNLTERILKKGRERTGAYIGRLSLLDGQHAARSGIRKGIH